MMDIARLAGFAIVSAAAALTVKRFRPELALPVSVAAGVIIMLAVLREFQNAFDVINGIADGLGVPQTYIEIVLKTVGIVYTTQFAADICRDAGENGIASRTELAGRIIIVSMCIPMFNNVMKLIKSIGGSL